MTNHFSILCVVPLDTLPKHDANRFVNSSVSGLLNSQKSTGLPIDVIHLIITAGAAIVFALLFTLVPLLFSRAGKIKWEGKLSFITYFSCLGLGFIVFELVFIQVFMKLIGYPLYTYTTVVFTFLFGAGVGSLTSEKLALMERRRIGLPFLGIIITTALLIVCQQWLFDVFLQFDTLCSGVRRHCDDFSIGLFSWYAISFGRVGHPTQTTRHHCMGVGIQWLVYCCRRHLLCHFLGVLWF